MKLKILLLSLLVIFVNCNLAFSAAVPDDDSAILVPVPEKKEETPIKKSVKKAPVKKTAKKSPPKKTAKKSTPKPQAPKVSSLERGIELMKQERYEAAKPWLIKAVQEEKNNPDAWYWYGVYYEKTGGFYQAQHFYSKAVKIDPSFEPLSRVVVYPEDPNGKNPLWDPKRPARVYPIETVNKNVVTIPPDSPQARKLPSRPQNDSELPKVPVYTPPEPGSAPLDGDDWRAGIYVPPTANQVRENQSAVYVPPSGNVISGQSGNNVILQLQADTLLVQPENSQNEETIPDTDIIIRADKPLYNPPKPGERIQERKIVNTNSKSPVPAKKQTTAAPRKVVRKNTSVAQQPRQTRTAQTSTRQGQTSGRNQQVSRDVTPTQTQNRTRENQTPVTPNVNQVTPAVPQNIPEVPEITENHIQNQNRNNNREGNRESNLPPVGQFSPDPGTISDTPLPPVGQGSTN